MAVLGTLYSNDGKLEHFGATLMLLFYAHQTILQYFTQNCLIFLESQVHLNLVIFHWALIAVILFQACCVQETLPRSLVQLTPLHPHHHLKVVCDCVIRNVLTCLIGSLMPTMMPTMMPSPTPMNCPQDGIWKRAPRCSIAKAPSSSLKLSCTLENGQLYY